MMLVTPNNGSQQVQFQIAEMEPEQGFSLVNFLACIPDQHLLS